MSCGGCGNTDPWLSLTTYPILDTIPAPVYGEQCAIRADEKMRMMCPMARIACDHNPLVKTMPVDCGSPILIPTSYHPGLRCANGEETFGGCRPRAKDLVRACPEAQRAWICNLDELMNP